MSRRVEIDHRLGDAPPRPVPPRPAPQMPGACASHGCGGGPHPARPPAPSFSVVQVNGVEIAPEAIAREMQHHPAPDPETAWRGAARALAIRALLIQEAARLGVACRPERGESGSAESEEDAIVRALLERELRPAAPAPEECRRVYDSAPERFRTPDLFEASHILIEPESPDEAGWTAAEALARMIAAEIGDDRDAFAAAAREFSRCPSAHQNGSLGQVRRGDLVPALQRALEALPPGTTGREPVRSRFGCHVLRLERRIPGRLMPFEVVQPKIADMLEARAWTIASAHYLAALARRAEVAGIDLLPPEAEVGGFA